jgi:hypothetical protein
MIALKIDRRHSREFATLAFQMTAAQSFVKKLTALLLILLLFFNWYGYRLLIAYWQEVAEERLQARLDGNDYDESSLISIKIPAAHLSYANASTAFERIDGEIILGDAAFKYVKRRIINDSVELLCIRNSEVMQLRETRDEFFQKINDFFHFPHSGTNNSAKSDIQKVYTAANLLFKVTKPEPIPTPSSCHVSEALPAGHTQCMERPPDHPLV